MANMKMAMTMLLTMHAGVGPAHAKKVFISNVAPRYNISGEIMDAHDGSYNQWGGKGNPFYYYAMGYGTCKQGGPLCHKCGYGYSWIGVWKSPDMSNNSWSLIREARDSSWPQAVYFRVHVVFNALTNLYVLWANIANCEPGCYVTGTSTTPEGPFTFKRAFGGRFPGAGDFDLFIDDDNKGYLIYTSTSQGHRMSVERLSDDFLTSVYAVPPPSPPPPMKGFDLVGSGACRDSAGKEPPFFTNEKSDSSLLSFHGLNETECAAACSGDSACTGFSWCDGEGRGRSCDGACHLYVVANEPSPPAPPPSTHAGWSFAHGQNGDPKNITRVTTESWWRCERKRKDEIIQIGGLSREIETFDDTNTGPTANSSGYFGNSFVEAPVMFKRNGVYYALFGECCCFCAFGSGIGVYTSSVSPLGPWTFHDNIGCQNSNGTSLQPPEGQGCGMGPLQGHSVTRAQQNFVLPVKTADDKTVLIWTGDMWQSAADGIKAHDLQFWSPIEWSEPTDDSISLPLQVKWIDNFTLDL